MSNRLIGETIGMERGSIRTLLMKLATPAAGDAWKAFLRKFSSLLVSVTRQYAHNDQQVNDCFFFVCEKLSDDGFRRLLAWERHEGVRFSSWLRAVVSHLCIDWRRSQDGRTRPFRSITSLPQLEQRVYHYRFERGLNLQSCLQALAPSFPALTELQLAAVVSRLNSTLTSQQHWLLSTRRHAVVSLDDPAVAIGMEVCADPAASPEALVLQDEQQLRLRQALNRLDAKQRLILKLRFQQGLTLKEVARLAGLGDAFKARYQIETALSQLAGLLES